MLGALGGERSRRSGVLSGRCAASVPSGKMTASGRPPVTAPNAPLVHRRSLLGFRAACEAMWGAERLVEVTRGLRHEVRDRTAGMLPLPEWLPVDDLIDWHLAVWNGPAPPHQDVFTPPIPPPLHQAFA